MIRTQPFSLLKLYLLYASIKCLLFHQSKFKENFTKHQITDHKEECTLGTSNFVLLTMSTTAIQYPAHSLVSFYGRSHKSHNKKTNFRQGQGVQFSRKVY